MKALTIKEYRNNLAGSFKRADNGERVLIRRKNRIYALTSVDREFRSITPELQQCIDEARKTYHNGNCTSCHNKKELEAHLDSL